MEWTEDSTSVLLYAGVAMTREAVSQSYRRAPFIYSSTHIPVPAGVLP
jgi:hypothetical protein